MNEAGTYFLPPGRATKQVSADQRLFILLGSHSVRNYAEDLTQFCQHYGTTSGFRKLFAVIGGIYRVEGRTGRGQTCGKIATLNGAALEPSQYEMGENRRSIRRSSARISPRAR